jgi:hypothetical protein
MQVSEGKSASDSFEALSQLQPTLCNILRQGAFVADYPAQDELRVGDCIPADASLLNLKSSSLQVDEESKFDWREYLTVNKLPGHKGSTVLVEKGDDAPLLKDQRGMLFSGQ